MWGPSPARARAEWAAIREFDGLRVGERTGHRAAMAAIAAAVVVDLASARWGRQAGEADDGDRPGSAEAVAEAARWMARLERLQGADGLFSSSGNLASPPDSAFTVVEAAQVVLVLQRCGGDAAGWSGLEARLRAMLERALPALVGGGVHTPNHRWELSAALARIGRVLGAPAASARARQWLAEGIDADENGVYSERSPNYASRVTNPSLLALAEELDRPDLRAVVHTNLHTTLDLTTPAGLTETVLSRLEDQRRRGFPLGPYLAQFAAFARECPRCLTAAAWAGSLPQVEAVSVLALALRDGGVRAGWMRLAR